MDVLERSILVASVNIERGLIHISVETAVAGGEGECELESG